MDSHSLTAIFAIILLVIMSAYFSATETAYTSMSRIKMKNAAGDGDEKAGKVLKLSDNYDKLLTTLLIGNNIANITMTAISTTLFIGLFGNRLGPTYSTIVITIVVLIFAEISPKTLAKEAPESFAKFAQPLAHGIMVILTPLNILFSGWKKLLVKVFNVGDERTITEDELITLVDEAEKEGGIESDQSELIQNAIEFNDLEAEEVMIPRVDMVAIDLDLSIEEVAEKFKDTGYSRIPVYDDDMDSILGVLNQKDFHNYIVGTGNTISDFVKPVVFVAGSMKIALLLKKMQALKTHMAIVIDEYGGTEGLLTMEDIIEELVGEIYDEHDAIMSQEVTELQNGSFRVMCNASLPKVFDYFGIEDDDIDANTVNGWVVLCLDKLPEKGDRFEYRNGHRVFKGRVTKATDKKALEINLVVEHVPDDEEEE
ncbi:MAG: hemolysin family protein [Eubacteriaceae bacterium]|nr:hemolysin family protein [Eubacteriaceae bacterium]